MNPKICNYVLDSFHVDPNHVSRIWIAMKKCFEDWRRFLISGKSVFDVPRSFGVSLAMTDRVLAIL